MRKWLPFAPADSPDVWQMAYHMLATRSGTYKPGNIFVSAVGAGPATPGTTKRAWCALLPDDTAVGYVGTTTKLYQYDGVSTFTDRSKGGGYTNTATDWSFCGFGNYNLATNRVDAIQVRDAVAAGAFADCAGTPAKARIMCTQSDAVLIADLNDGAEKGDSFAACASGDHTDWSGAGAMTPTRIRHRPGKITAMVPFRDYVLVFKRSSIYKLTYTGNTYKWKIELISIGRGAWGKHDVVNCGDTVVFNGPGGSWIFDGASFTDISSYMGELTGSYSIWRWLGAQNTIASIYDPLSGNAYFFIGGSGVGTQALVYNVVSDAWGTFFFVNTSDAYSATDYTPLAGEPAAIRVFTGGSTALDAPWAINLSANPCVITATTKWGAGAGGFSAILVGGLEGAGGDKLTTFSRLIPDCTTSIINYDDTDTPTATELRCDVYTANVKDAAAVNFLSGLAVGLGTPAPKQSNVVSSTVQRRFDFLQTSVYARFAIKLPSNSGYVEIADYSLLKTPAGSL